MDDPYKVLGISHGATDDEVKKAYREMSRKYHPDTYAGTNNPLANLAEEKFKEVQDAYSQIMDMRANGNHSSYGNQGGYQNNYYGNQGGYQNNAYGPFGNAGGNFNRQQYNRQRYDDFGMGYGRNPYGYNNGGCGTGNMCCDLWCADTMCECMGGDLCNCM